MKRRLRGRYYSLIVYQDEDDIADFLDNQKIKADSIKYLISKIYDQIGNKDLFDYLKNNNLTVKLTSLDEAVQVKNKKAGIKRKNINKTGQVNKSNHKDKKKRIDKAENDTSPDLNFWSEDDDSF